jgi:DNA-binding Lrp family transcriptional regulator
MVTAFIMITVGAGEHLSWLPTVKEKVEKLPGVVEAHCVMGRYDIIAKVKVRAWGELVNLVSDKIRSIPGVSATETFVGYEE